VDTVRFEIGERTDPADGLVDALDIFVNGRNPMDIVREVELPFVFDRAQYLSALSRNSG
jgi:hypothetical protein